MKVILRYDVDRLGAAGEVVAVKDGYARNYLFPMNLAIPASKGNLAAIGEVKKQKTTRDRKVKSAAETLKSQIEAMSLTAEVLVGEEDRVFGSVTTRTIADLAAAEGISIDRRKIELEEPIKNLGVYDVPVRLHAEVPATIKVWVVRQKGPVDPELLARLQTEEDARSRVDQEAEALQADETVEEAPTEETGAVEEEK
jgi:large subunit ribosomal protein L9